MARPANLTPSFLKPTPSFSRLTPFTFRFDCLVFAPDRLVSAPRLPSAREGRVPSRPPRFMHSPFVHSILVLVSVSMSVCLCAVVKGGGRHR